MFPTSGLFQDLLCPMFSDGSCDRPYCHFNHSKADPTATPAVKNTKEAVNVNADQSATAPVYKPTPIKLLEQREQLTSTDRNPNGPLTTAAASSRSSDVPVYQPTPISELEKYAPCSLNIYGLPGDEKGGVALNQPIEPPTYSPVVRQKSAIVGSLGTPTYPPAFNYQPSPAYPPLPTTKIPAVNLRDASEIPVGSPTEAVPNQSTKTPKHKHGVTSGETSSPVEPRPKYPSESPNACSCKRSATDEPEEPDDSPATAATKRQKILSLYKDLYGDQPLPSKLKVDEPPTGKAKGPKLALSPILPYVGAPLTKPSKKDPEGDRRLQSEPKEDVDGTASTVVLNPRPRAPLKKSDKIPMPIRTRYLDQFIEECLVIYESPNDAYDRALTDEQACHDKATSRMAYLNAVIQRLKSLKAEKLQVQAEGVRKAGSGPKKAKVPVAKPEHVKDGAESAEKQLDEIVQGPLLYDHLRSYLLTEEQLVDNGFPREDKSADAPYGKAKLLFPDDKRSIYDSCPRNEHLCSRCGARYCVDELGNAVVYEKCIYHWSRPVKQRIPGMGVELRYLCCQSDLGQPGCQLCTEGHVHEANKWLDTEGFVATLPPLVPIRDGSAHSDIATEESTPVNVYAIDCEMVYTTAGCELGRVTVVDTKFQPVLDSIVRPYNTIIDCNTRFSGLKREEIEQCDTRITDIQSKLLHLFDSDTILIGHSLESDLVALKLIHSKVVDTSIMFPHRYGPPKKRALRNLVSELLNRIIQQDDNGHNSLEDAIACMQLVQHKVKEDLRRGKWSLK
ncbi:hypothetical protein CRM22_004873 [Opisthorchis felineus]|uniref:Exonuclease domain-containing protein n=1 Tax=Opisthorchis felineus TaxID=147828 RepID=A0A4S2M0I3_OPIFE|nr:hypothetical protein CRM22_004873 [Opisthorchis felineus]TGZ67328.1 hypothetical protein CRM22_004873 [Opisthorchis felineus]TGZ67329.1 hypothetical protein CRM22_004873 [Opisthorchis felineus]TGZ67330.1 hypothetical protein CRM22_004873 [Opisthorchis felineus]